MVEYVMTLHGCNKYSTSKYILFLKKYDEMEDRSVEDDVADSTTLRSS